MVQDQTSFISCRVCTYVAVAKCSGVCVCVCVCSMEYCGHKVPKVHWFPRDSPPFLGPHTPYSVMLTFAHPARTVLRTLPRDGTATVAAPGAFPALVGAFNSPGTRCERVHQALYTVPTGLPGHPSTVQSRQPKTKPKVPFPLYLPIPGPQHRPFAVTEKKKKRTFALVLTHTIRYVPRQKKISTRTVTGTQRAKFIT